MSFCSIFLIGIVHFLKVFRVRSVKARAMFSLFLVAFLFCMPFSSAICFVSPFRFPSFWGLC